MELNNKHLGTDEFKFYIELSGNKTQLTEVQKKSLTDIENHLNSCFKCNAEYLFLKSVYFEKISRYGKAKRKRKTVLIASASIITLLFLSQLLFFSGNKPDQIITDSDETILNDSIKDNKKTNIDIAKKDSFEGEPSLIEKDKNEHLLELLYAYVDLVKSNKFEVNLVEFAEESGVELPKAFAEDFRQDLRIKNIDLRDTENVKAISPENFSILKAPIIFEWGKIEDSVSVVIKNNLNENVWEEKTTGTSKIKFDEELKPGTYYWDLRVNDKVQGKYKFFIVPLTWYKS